MKNKILKFEMFKKGTPEQKPEKQVDVAGGMPTTQKEKSFDQVKRAKLAMLDKTEPDYSKVRKMNEATGSADAVKAAADKLAGLQQQANMTANLIIGAQQELTKAQANMASATTTTTAAPASTSTEPAPTAAPAATTA
jgi:hypothetical protein